MNRFALDPSAPLESISLKYDFLQQQRPIIDAITGHPARMLAYLALLPSGHQLMTAHDIAQQACELQGEEPVLSARNIYQTLSPFIEDTLSVGLVSTDHHSRRFDSTPPVRITTMGIARASIAGALISTQLTYELPLGTALTRSYKAPESRTGTLYPFAPSRRLRIAQALTATDGAMTETIAQAIGMEPRNMQSHIKDMQRDGLVYPTKSKGNLNVYHLTEAAYKPMTYLLLCLRSLKIPAFRQSAAKIATTLANPETSSPHVQNLIRNWR
jgi:DNA-binding transcriptional ArsR family regulator